MPCLVLFVAMFAPRLVVALLYLFSRWFDGLFTTVLWPVLGFLFMPTTLLWFTVVQHWFGGQWTFWPIAGIVLAIMIDSSPAGGRRYRRRQRGAD